jgi:hypothetical protein
MSKHVVFSCKDKNSVDISKYRAIKLYEHLRKQDVKRADNNPSVFPYLRKDRKRGDVWFNVFQFNSVDECSYYRDIFKYKVDVLDNKIHINTIHGVKGGEADNVVFLLDVTKSIDKVFFSNNIDIELRCLYVAMTRAKKNLHIIYSNSKFGYNNIINDIKGESNVS